MEIECTTFVVSANQQQNEDQVEHVSTSEGTLIYEDEQSMAEWEHVDAGSLAAVDLESPCEIVKTDDAVFAVPAVPPLKHTPDEPPDVDLYDLVEQMSYQNESSEEIPVIPEYLCDRITHEIFQDPVVTPGGITYERKNIEDHLNTVGNFDPITHVRLTSDDILPDHRTRIALDEFTAMNPEVVSVAAENVNEQELHPVDSPMSSVPAYTLELENSTEIDTTTV